MLRSQEYIKAMLLDLAWFEAEGQGGVRPMQMVAQCVANRVRMGWGSWSQVLSTVHDDRTHAIGRRLMGEMLVARALPDVADPRFRMMLAAIDGIYDNTFEDLVKGGLYWADMTWSDLRMANPWFWFNIVGDPKHSRCGSTGTFCTWS